MERPGSRCFAAASPCTVAGGRDLVGEPVQEIVPVLVAELAPHPHDDQVLVGSDEDELTQVAAREEARLAGGGGVARPNPPEVAVARAFGAAGRRLRRGRRGYPICRNELVVAPATVPQVEQAELRVVDGAGVDPALHL